MIPPITEYYNTKYPPIINDGYRMIDKKDGTQQLQIKSKYYNRNTGMYVTVWDDVHTVKE